MKLTSLPLLKICYRYCIQYPRQIIKYLHYERTAVQKSYYPEVPIGQHKSKSSRIIEQVANIYRFGGVEEFYFPYGFDCKSKQEQKEYVNLYEFRNVRQKLNLSDKHNCSCILRDKMMFGIYTNGIGLKTANIVFYTTDNGIFDYSSKCRISVKDIVNGSDRKLFCKLVDGECGNGIFILRVDKHELYIDEKHVSAETLEKELSKGRYLAQEMIEQHSEMSRLHEKSVNSIRLVTVRSLKDGKIHVLPSILRIGTGNNIVDNTSQGGLSVGIEMETGKLRQYGFYKPQYGLKTNVHPDSKVVFCEFEIPYFEEVKKQATYYHSMLPNLHSIGWDIAIGKEGPLFIEGNDNWEINGPQICNGGFREYFNEYFK